MSDHRLCRIASAIGLAALAVACTHIQRERTESDRTNTPTAGPPTHTATISPTLTLEATSTAGVQPTLTSALATPTLSLDDLATAVARETLPPTELVSANRQDEARTVLERYLGALARGAYEEADALYGGSFESLWGLTIFRLNPADRLEVWALICNDGYLQCLPVRDVTLVEATPTELRFEVSFSNPDGSLFMVGPCCGGNATDHPPVSSFEYTVIQSEDNLLVVGLPPYVP